MPVTHLGSPHWESLKWTNEFSRRARGLYKCWLCLTVLLWLFSPCLSLSLNISSPMKPSLIPPDRNVASCFFSEQLLGTTHTVLETGGKNTHPPPDASSQEAHILMGKRTSQQVSQWSNKMTADKHHCYEITLWKRISQWKKETGWWQKCSQERHV